MVCRDHLLTEKWLVAPSLRVGHQWLEAVVLGGQPVVNVHVKTIKSLAIDLAAPAMAARGLTLATGRASALLIDRVLRGMQGDKLKYLGSVEPSAEVAETFLATIEAVRLAGLDATRLAVGPFEVAAKGKDLSLIAQNYLQLLAQERLIDYADVLRLATERLAALLKPGGIGSDALVLPPVDFRGQTLEQRFLAQFPASRLVRLAVDEPADSTQTPCNADSGLERLRWLLNPTAATAPCTDQTASILRAIGEVNEVRQALRSCITRQTPWDQVELLHTDTDTYVALIYETLATVERPGDESLDELPVTFAEGIPCRYARPGRALAGWLQWIHADFPQAALERLIKEGLLEVPGVGAGVSGVTRLAGLVRGLGIGAGRQRYLPALAGKIKALEQELQDGVAPDDDDADSLPQRRTQIERDLRDFKALQELIARLLDHSPDPDARPQQIITAAVGFVEQIARSVNKLDRFASVKLLEELRDMQHWLSREDGEVNLDIWTWLKNLPAETCVLGSGPRPGCLHVDSVFGGGHSGRPQTFIMGLDDSRFPGAGLQDPLLLDGERRKLSDGMPTAAGRLQDRLEDFVRLLARLRGQVTLSYACQSVEDDREMFASPAILAAFRLLAGRPDGDQQDLLQWLPPPVSFAPREADGCLDTAEWWLWRLCGPESVQDATGLVERRFPHLAAGRQATATRLAPEFSAYDGAVPLAGIDLNPTGTNGRVLSASGLQTIGRCPRAFFFHYALDIEPPDDTTLDPNCWLDALQFGSLLHELFERFMRELVSQGLLPEFGRDRPRLVELLDEQVQRYRDLYPPSNESVFQRQCQDLRTTALTFLREEEDFCKETGGQPIYLEASLGLPPGEHKTPLDDPEPITIALPKGKSVRVRGRIDRIDRISKGIVQTYGIWDYKTGSTYGYDKAEPFRQGRLVQPYLYVTMVSHRLRQAVSPDAQVAHFGFFFPGTKARGQRIQWTPAELDAGKELLGNLVEIVSQGAFLATNDWKQDCTFCDYRPICGDFAAVSAASQSMLDHEKNKILAPFRAARSAVEE